MALGLGISAHAVRDLDPRAVRTGAAIHDAQEEAPRRPENGEIVATGVRAPLCDLELLIAEFVHQPQTHVRHRRAAAVGHQAQDVGAGAIARAVPDRSRQEKWKGCLG